MQNHKEHSYNSDNFFWDVVVQWITSHILQSTQWEYNTSDSLGKQQNVTFPHFGEHSHWYLVAFFLSSSSLCWSVAALRASLSVYWLWQYSLISWRACLVLSGLKLRSISLHRDFSSVIEFHRLHTLQKRHRCYLSCMKKAKYRGTWFKSKDHWHNYNI